MTVQILHPVWFYSGLAFLLLAITQLLRTKVFLQRAVFAEGQIIELRMKSGSEGPIYAPIVTFNGPSGPVQFESKYASSPSGWKVGDLVSVAYDPADPTNASIRSFMPLWFGAIMASVVGIFCLIYGMGLLPQS
jgi:hypothetical protein